MHAKGAEMCPSLCLPGGNAKVKAIIHENERGELHLAPPPGWLWCGLSRQATCTNPGNPPNAKTVQHCLIVTDTPPSPLLPHRASPPTRCSSSSGDRYRKQAVFIYRDSACQDWKINFQQAVLLQVGEGTQLQSRDGPGPGRVISRAQICWINHFSQT